MKSPKTKFVVISTISLASITGIFVLAQSPTPSASVEDLPVHLVMQCAQVNEPHLKAALQGLPLHTYKFRFEDGSVIGNLANCSPPPCPAHFRGSSTQTATFANTKDLRAFMDNAGL